VREVCYCSHRADLEDRLPIVDECGQGALRCRECRHVVGQQKVSFAVRPQKSCPEPKQREKAGRRALLLRGGFRPFLAPQLIH
jgi:hypothetical protein